MYNKNKIRTNVLILLGGVIVYDYSILPNRIILCVDLRSFYHFSQEDSFLKEREVSRWEMNWLRTRDGRKPS
ncbi:hypothetical protein COM08_24720 [Bacillus wiedmannii]|nr:hypothetical protein COL51_27750 [Bacillus wiedmannii]PGC14517.1 hypothetical protein COM08_24720 [Bacillus wiedmannii]PGC50150.1 hypothetical protein COM22_29010 [Bacillus wiedmannii]PHE66730.1 hypothetical protein COF77_31625 [Bacillus wiedmannii]